MNIDLKKPVQYLCQIKKRNPQSEFRPFPHAMAQHVRSLFVPACNQCRK